MTYQLNVTGGRRCFGELQQRSCSMCFLCLKLTFGERLGLSGDIS